MKSVTDAYLKRLQKLLRRAGKHWSLKLLRDVPPSFRRELANYAKKHIQNNPIIKESK